MRLPKLSHRIIKGVLFDLDGTCVDSEFLSPLAWASVLKEIGLQEDQEEDDLFSIEKLETALAAPELRGASANDVADHLIQMFDIRYNDDPNHLVKRKRVRNSSTLKNTHVPIVCSNIIIIIIIIMCTYPFSFFAIY